MSAETTDQGIQEARALLQDAIDLRAEAESRRDAAIRVRKFDPRRVTRAEINELSRKARAAGVAVEVAAARLRELERKEEG